MKVVPIIERICTDSQRSEEAYGSWSEDWSSSVIAVRQGDAAIGADDEDSFLIADGSTHAHVLAVTYTEGDSFGTAGGMIAVIHVFGDLARAEAAQAAYEASAHGTSFEFKDDFDRDVKMMDPAGADAVSGSRTAVYIVSLAIS